MIMLILAYLVSLIPMLAVFFYFRNGVLRFSQTLNEHQKLCDKAFVYGLLSTVFVVLVSATLHIGGNILGVRSLDPVPQAMYHTVIVLAFAEELMKFTMFLQLIRKNPQHQFTWLEVIIYMVCVATGFELLESVVYAFGSGVGHMLVRGITDMHAGFGFVMGYFYGKARTTGNKAYYVPAFLIPWFMHGLYDFALSEEINAVFDWFGMIALLLAVICAVLLVYMILFMRKAKNKKVYMTPLPKA